MFLTLGITLSITKGMLKVICARRIVIKPEPRCRNLNSSISEIPVTISAFIIGMLVTPMITERSFDDKPIIAMHVKVPIIVEKIVASTAMASVLKSALATASSEKRLIYQSNVNPPQRALDLLELKDKTMSVTIGAYIKIRMTAR